MIKFVPRASWGARLPEHRTTGALSAESTCHWNGPTITVGGSKTWDHSRCAGLVRGIQNFHMDSRGWSDIAYNFLECPHGYTFEGRGLNVVNGANGTTSGNRSSHAVCCLAGEENPFPEAEKVGFKSCINYISDNTLAPNTCKGHRDHKTTECPGDERYAWVHSGMPTQQQPTPTPKPIPTAKDQPMLFQTPAKSVCLLVDGKLILIVDNMDGTTAAERAQLMYVQASMPIETRTPIPCDTVFWKRLSTAFPVVR